MNINLIKTDMMKTELSIKQSEARKLRDKEKSRIAFIEKK